MFEFLWFSGLIELVLIWYWGRLVIGFGVGGCV